MILPYYETNKGYTMLPKLADLILRDSGVVLFKDDTNDVLFIVKKDGEAKLMIDALKNCTTINDEYYDKLRLYGYTRVARFEDSYWGDSKNQLILREELTQANSILTDYRIALEEAKVKIADLEKQLAAATNQSQ